MSAEDVSQHGPWPSDPVFVLPVEVADELVEAGIAKRNVPMGFSSSGASHALGYALIVFNTSANAVTIASARSQVSAVVDYLLAWVRRTPRADGTPYKLQVRGPRGTVRAEMTEASDAAALARTIARTIFSEE